MIKAFDYHSRTWRKIRAAVLRRDEYLCQECRRFGKSAEANTVHHILPAEDCAGKHESFKFDSVNLISLCGGCHNAMHDRDTGELTAAGKDLLRRRGIKTIGRTKD